MRSRSQQRQFPGSHPRSSCQPIWQMRCSSAPATPSTSARDWRPCTRMRGLCLGPGWGRIPAGSSSSSNSLGPLPSLGWVSAIEWNLLLLGSTTATVGWNDTSAERRGRHACTCKGPGLSPSSLLCLDCASLCPLPVVHCKGWKHGPPPYVFAATHEQVQLRTTSVVICRNV